MDTATALPTPPHERSSICSCDDCNCGLSCPQHAKENIPASSNGPHCFPGTPPLGIVPHYTAPSQKEEHLKAKKALAKLNAESTALDDTWPVAPRKPIRPPTPESPTRLAPTPLAEPFPWDAPYRHDTVELVDQSVHLVFTYRNASVISTWYSHVPNSKEPMVPIIVIKVGVLNQKVIAMDKNMKWKPVEKNIEVHTTFDAVKVIKEVRYSGMECYTFYTEEHDIPTTILMHPDVRVELKNKD